MILFPEYESTDLHSHILPHMDHGCVDEVMAENAFQQAQKVGIKTICATSHFYPSENHVDSFLERRAQQIELMTPIASKYGIHLIPGAEVQVQNDISSCGDLSRLAMGELDSILIELPFIRDISRRCIEHVYHLMIKSKLQIIIAHPDRYPLPIVEECLSFGCVLQLNAEACSDRKGKKQAVRWMRDDCVFGFGTDFHRDSESSYSLFEKAIHLSLK